MPRDHALLFKGWGSLHNRSSLKNVEAMICIYEMKCSPATAIDSWSLIILRHIRFTASWCAPTSTLHDFHDFHDRFTRNSHPQIYKWNSWLDGMRPNENIWEVTGPLTRKTYYSDFRVEWWSICPSLQRGQFWLRSLSEGEKWLLETEEVKQWIV
jgi:hypothetical protein